MKKRALSLLLALVLVIGLLPVTVRAGELDNGLQYEIYEDYASTVNLYVRITGYTGDATDLVIPAEIEGLPVTAIADPWRVSFDCPNLRTISLPPTLTKISGNPFSGCPNLTAIYVDEANPNFFHSQNGCLLNQDKTALLIVPAGTAGVFTIPEGTDTITVDAFDSCRQITSIVVHDGVTQLGGVSYGYSNDNCDGMTDSVSYAFGSCTNLVSFDVDPQNPVYASDSTGALYTKDYSTLLCVPAGTKGSYTIAENPSIIDAWSFFKCKQITKLFVPNSVARVEQSAFSGCDELKELYFMGDAPVFDIIEYADSLGTIKHGSFSNITANLYYPAGNETWDNAIAYADGHISGNGYDSIRYTYDYGGNITWIPYILNPFTDVPEGAFYHEPVMWAIEKNITNGLTATEFGPNVVCNRAQVVTFLWRAAGSPEPASTENPFVDVQAGSFYEKPVLWAVEKGITNGSDATHFNPNSVCNRAQVVTFLYRAFESPAVGVEGLPFIDVPADSWYEAPIAWAVENGITNGLTATEFGPTAACNRAQVVTFLYRAYN